MRPNRKKLIGASLIAPGLLFVSLLASRGQGDEPSRLSRLFRLGGGSSASPAPTSPTRGNDVGAPALRTATNTTTSPYTGPTGPTSPASRIVPRPRVTRAATEADPIVTRVSLGRSNDGSQFGMFLQVFADGTVLDSEGEHHVSRETLRPIVEALQAGELYRVKGHCGSPGTDFIEQVHMVVYERNLGRLRANTFSYSGNPQGCEHAVAHLHAALEGLQLKISKSASAATANAPVSSSPNASAPAPPFVAPGQPTTIPLSPGQ